MVKQLLVLLGTPVMYNYVEKFVRDWPGRSRHRAALRGNRPTFPRWCAAGAQRKWARCGPRLGGHQRCAGPQHCQHANRAEGHNVYRGRRAQVFAVVGKQVPGHEDGLVYTMSDAAVRKVLARKVGVINARPELK